MMMRLYLLGSFRLESGKRLAIQIAAALTPHFTDGIWWVDLAALNDPVFVPGTMAKVLGLSENPEAPVVDTLVNYLRSKQLLLILDNCEHLVMACAQLGDALLQACPALQILATSREALGLTGEIVWPLQTLSLPDDPLEADTDVEVIRLFVDRAATVKLNFKLTKQTMPFVVQICQQLDGLPLAIELAAARVKLLSVEQIAARLDDRFNLLTGGSRAALPRPGRIYGHPANQPGHNLIRHDHPSLRER